MRWVYLEQAWPRAPAQSRQTFGKQQARKERETRVVCSDKDSCEAPMAQARATLSKIFNGEPHSYTRFSLTQNMEGDNSQVEMKLSSDVDEEAGGDGVADNLNHNSNTKPYMAPKLGRAPRNLCFMAAIALLIFIIGYLIGYLVHWKKDLVPSCTVASPTFEDSNPPPQTHDIPLMDWDNVKKLIAQKVTADKFEPIFSDFTIGSHQAGSTGDEVLANKVYDKFKDYDMKTWSDEHFVKVQDPPASGFNKIVLKNNVQMLPDGFLSYSACGNVTGALLYGYYGLHDDFMLLQDKGIDLNGRVMLLRAGQNSFAEKVANAAKFNASAVLIYPDPDDYAFDDNTQLFGHVHFGSGDPYTPGFPSFNNTQFPPVASSGLPKILAQTITARMAFDIKRHLGGPNIPSQWRGINRLGDESDVVTLEVNNVLTEKKIHNVFGVIKGIVDPDRYLVIGAQRDAWGSGFATSTVGTSVLVELARSISEMVKEGLKPRRSIVFASWSGGEYGSVGATEWLEGYLSSMNMKAFSYINLDRVVAGQNTFKVAASPLMYSLVDRTLNEVNSPNQGISLFAQYAKGNWESNLLEPLSMDNAAFPFLAFSGIPSLSFRFTSNYLTYPYFGTKFDTREQLNIVTSNQVPQLAVAAAHFAGHIALRLVHDHLLQLDVTKYDKVIRTQVALINSQIKDIKRLQPQLFPKALTVQWLISASGTYSRASRKLATDIMNSNLQDIETCRLINDRIMAVERNLLSPYVSLRDSPFRHILLGSGSHTLKALSSHVNAFKAEKPDADGDLFRNQFALATWTLQGCAYSLAGDIWSVHNEI